MNFTVNEITNSIAGKPSLRECSVDELRELTSHYPFFGPAQFLFVKKLKEENSWQLNEQVRKASLYFQNPLWFDHLLNVTAETAQEFVPVPVSEREVPVTTEDITDNYLPDATAENATATPLTKDEFFTDPAVEKEVPVPHEEAVDNYLPNSTGNPTAPTPVTGQEFMPEPAAKMEIPVTHEEVVDQTGVVKKPEWANGENQAGQQQPELLVEMPKFRFQPIDTSKTQLAFEPYHTIDYFASQGIKPATEEKPKDQFSRQLKSFTEWLKVMKKLPVTEIAAAVSVVEEKKVEKMAELSINDREVVTEAMAEVWEKQGNQAKAREIYEKLSLHNPDKSSYFAAKIDQLKNL